MAKLPVKVASDRTRRVRVLDNAETEAATIGVKLYKLNAELAAPFIRDGKFSFRIAFDKIVNGKPKMMHRSRCPVIAISEDEVVQTENETAQRMLENFIVPTKTVRNGATRQGGHLFEDVTATATEYDIDLDATFDAV